jgi:hypothetical protein
MLAGIYNITCQQGSTFVRVIRIEYPDAIDPTIFHPFDLDGYSARMQVRRTISSATPMISLDTDDNGIEITSAADGEITITMTDAQTAALTTDGVYDLEIISATDFVTRILQGEFRLSLEVTR